MARISRFSLALACVALCAAPVAAESTPDAPVFTENIEQTIAPMEQAAAKEMPAQTNEASLDIRFDKQILHYAVLPPLIRSVPQFGNQVITYAAAGARPQLMMAGDRYRALNTT